MLEIKDLVVKTEDKSILNKFNFEVNSGKIVVIMGPNGVGKSTICRVILGDPNYKIEKGTIKYNGRIINDLSTTERARMGIYYISQNPIAIEGVTNAQMLRTSLMEVKKENICIKIFNKELESICETLDIPKNFIHKNINEGASGGERKKIELLHLWVLKPSLILLDELDSGLDVDAIKKVIKSLNKYYKEYNPTIIIITHHFKILNLLKPSRVYILQNGTIVKSGSIELARKIENNGFKKAFSVSENEENE